MNQMCWLSPDGLENGTKILHLKIGDGAWKPYTSFPQLAVADYKVSGGSKGFATFQKLLNAGWEVVPSPNFNMNSTIESLAAKGLKTIN